MNILTRTIVSNSEMIKNYKACRDKTETFGKIFSFKNNQPDAVLFSITEYGRLSAFIEYLEGLEEDDIASVAESLLKSKHGKRHSIDQ